MRRTLNSRLTAIHWEQTSMSSQANKPIFVYVGTYTRSMPHVQAKAEGVYIYTMDPQNGNLTPVGVAAGVENPSYLALHPSGRYLYAVNEVTDYGGKSSGAVTALAIDDATGLLTLLNQQSSGGAAPCYVSVDATGSLVMAANYGGGSMVALPIQADGSLGEASDFIQHVGSSVNANRQQEPHGHSIVVDPTNRFAMAADLGMDKLIIYQMDLGQGKLQGNQPPWAAIHPGAGPRHTDFHPNGRTLYLINEIDSTLTVFAYTASAGALTPLQTLSTLPQGFEGRNSTADLHVHPSGRFVYGSNRGHNSIAIFGVDEATGTLTALGHQSTLGETPRNFAIDPSGRFLYAANQNSSTIAIFSIDGKNGALTPTGSIIDSPTPVCIKFRG